ncbi:ribonuclease H-like domain-containing protein [Tanacetum coccineum]
MSVYNSLLNTPVNSEHDDDYIQAPDHVTRISKLDISDPLHLHPNDTTALTVVSIKLKGTENYQVWSCAMLLALEGKNKISFIDGSCKRSNTYEEELKETYDKVDGSIIFGLHNQINTLKQVGSSIIDYYHKLNALWKQFDAMIELPKCVCNASKSFKNHNQLMKLMQFLIGLDDSYMQIRSSILSREVLPDVRSAYTTISSEESHRVVVGSMVGSSQRNQAYAFVSNVPDSQKFREVIKISILDLQGLIICFKIIGYPANFGKKKSSQNFKKQGVSNNNSIRKFSSSGFSNEQKASLLSLIKDNKIRKNVQANMAGANQHMTYSDKGLDNVVDISHLKIKVGHSNGTEAFISKIGNLNLSNGLTWGLVISVKGCTTIMNKTGSSCRTCYEYFKEILEF